MSLPRDHDPLRQAVAHLLLDPQYNGIICTFDQLISPLTTLGGVVGGRENSAKVDHDLIMSAFNQTGLGAAKEYVKSYEDLGVDVPHDKKKHYLLVRSGLPSGRKSGDKKGKHYELCHFTGSGVGKKRDWCKVNDKIVPAAGSHSELPNHPLQSDQPFWLPESISHDTRTMFNEYLKGEKVRRDKRAAKKKRQQEQASAKKKDAGGENQQQQNNNSPRKSSKKRRKGTRERVPTADEVMTLKMSELRQEMLQKAIEMSNIKLQYIKQQQQNDRSNEKENNGIRVSVPTPKTSFKRDVAAPFYYKLPDGRVGQIPNFGAGIIFEDDLEDGLVDLPAGKDDDKSAAIRAKRGTNLAAYGASQAWIPDHTTLVSTDYLTKLKEDAVIVKKLRDAFSAGKCVFRPEVLGNMAAYNLSNYGGSDEATEMITAGAYAGLFEQIGFVIDPKRLAKGCPSSRTLSRYEHHLAVDCLIKVMQEIKDDGAKVVGIITDHGHRGGQDHYVVVIIWSGYDENGEKTIKFFCPSIDRAGHKGLSAAQGVKNVLDRFLGEEGIKAHALTGDAGGGASVQNLVKELAKLGIICKETNCSLHGLQKALENASKKTLGDQGMGYRTPFQMLYLFALLMGKIREDGGISQLDTLWSVVTDQMLNNDEWQTKAKKEMKQAWYEFLDTIASFDESDPDQLDSLVKFMTEAPRNIQDPVWTRWSSIIKTCEIFLDNYAAVYFLAVGAKGHYKSESYIWKIACALISLMRERAEPSLKKSESLGSYIDSFSSEAAATKKGCDSLEDPIQSGDSPTFYTMLLFHRGFCEYAFNDNFNFLLRNNLIYGKGTFGQLSQFMAERTYVMSKHLNDLKNGGWAQVKGKYFTKYKEALKGIPKESTHSADRAFFEKMPDTFIAEATTT